MNENTPGDAVRHACSSPNTGAPPASHTESCERAQLSSLPDPCTSAQLAALLSKSPKTIVDWCQERGYTGIPCFRLGNRWYHRRADLVKWLNGIRTGRIRFRRKPQSSAERR